MLCEGNESTGKIDVRRIVRTEVYFITGALLIWHLFFSVKLKKTLHDLKNCLLLDSVVVWQLGSDSSKGQYGVTIIAVS